MKCIISVKNSLLKNKTSNKKIPNTKIISTRGIPSRDFIKQSNEWKSYSKTLYMHCLNDILWKKQFLICIMQNEGEKSSIVKFKTNETIFRSQLFLVTCSIFGRLFSYSVYIFQLFRYVGVCGHVKDFVILLALSLLLFMCHLWCLCRQNCRIAYLIEDFGL